MKAITLATLGIAVSIVGLGNSVQAQSAKTPNSEGGTSSANGTSLIGVDNRTSQDDFSQFFGMAYSGRATQNNTATPSKFNETLSLPNTPFLLEPGSSAFYGNDGAQFQVDLSNLDAQPQK